MGRLAPDHCTHCHDPVIALAGQEPARSERKLPRPGHPDDVDVVERDAILDQRLERSVDEFLYDGLIEAAGDDDDAPADAARQSVELGHL